MIDVSSALNVLQQAKKNALANEPSLILRVDRALDWLVPITIRGALPGNPNPNFDADALKQTGEYLAARLGSETLQALQGRLETSRDVTGIVCASLGLISLVAESYTDFVAGAIFAKQAIGAISVLLVTGIYIRFRQLDFNYWALTLPFLKEGDSRFIGRP